MNSTETNPQTHFDVFQMKGGMLQIGIIIMEHSMDLPQKLKL